jgi:hypothetical protein
VLRESTVACMLCQHTVGQGIHQGLSWFLAFPVSARNGAPLSCGFWHTSSSACLVAADCLARAAVVILGQTILEAELTPVRVAEWFYVRGSMRLAPSAPEVGTPREAHRWLRELDTSPREHRFAR